MLTKLLLEEEPFDYTAFHLPCLISGAYGSGASYFSVSLVANLIAQGNKVLFFTAFPMAKEELLEQIDRALVTEVTDPIQIDQLSWDTSILVQSGNEALLKKLLKALPPSEQFTLFIKNIEAYDRDIRELAKGYQARIISGDLDRCKYAEDIIAQSWASKIYFTHPSADPGSALPMLKKYEGYITSEQLTGIITLQKTMKQPTYPADKNQ